MVQAAMSLTLATYSFDDPASACARLRLYDPAAALGRAVRLLPGAIPDGPGHHLRLDILAHADGVFIQRYFPSPDTADVLETIFASGKPVLYDTDDDWTALPSGHAFAQAMAKRLPHILETARRARLVTVTTARLAEVFAAINPRVTVVPNFLPEALWRPVAPPTRPVVAVGLAATASHEPDIAPLSPVLAGLARELAGKLRFVFFGCAPDTACFPGATAVPFDPAYAAYAGRLARLGCGIGLAPLADTAFNRAKSPIKWMEYALCGMAGIFADLPPYRDVVEQERTGLLVGPDPADWGEAVRRLVLDAPLRRTLAANAQETVMARHMLAGNAAAFLRAWTRAVTETP